MSVEIVVLVDGGRGLTQTVESLRTVAADGAAQVSLLASAPRPQLADRLDHLVAEQPAWRVLTMAARGRTQGVLEILRRSRSSHVSVIVAGSTVVPAGLSRMDLAASAGAPVVVGRHSGSALWGLTRDVVDLRPPANASAPMVVVSVELARKHVEPLEGGLAAEEWVSAWHSGILGQVQEVAAVVERPAVAGPRPPDPEWLHPLTSRAAWDGAVLDAGVSCASAPSTGQPGLATWRMLAVDMLSGDEVLLDSAVAAGEGWRDVAARFDVATLTDGVWRPAVEMVDPTAHGRGWLRVEELPDLVVHGRPVAVTRQGDYLELQVGRLRRSVLRVDPAAEPATVDGGRRVSLPLVDLQVVGEEPGQAVAVWGEEQLEAGIVRGEHGARLELASPSRTGSFPLLVRFGTGRAVGCGIQLSRTRSNGLTVQQARAEGPAQPRWPARAVELLRRVGARLQRRRTPTHE